MPVFNSLNVAMWAITLIVEISLSVGMIRTRAAERWRAVWVYVTFNAAKSIFLGASTFLPRDHNLRASVYFYSYWIGELASSAIAIFILWSVVGSLTGVNRRVRGILARAFSVLVAISLVASGMMAARTSPLFYLQITREALSIHSGLSLAWCLAFLAVACSSAIAGLYWRREVLTIAFGWAMNAVAQLLCSWFVSSTGMAHWDIAFNLNGSFYLVTLISWATVFLRAASDSTSYSPINPRALESALMRLKDGLEAFR
ncbi:hypothetical protein [Silvibacterium acidisoli]|uniref:hypothetical protein n=1 Tax=Acidobacteriaceae bacterium ZG23-2 TaxID=2883246 RepID=UPI00406CEB8D